MGVCDCIVIYVPWAPYGTHGTVDMILNTIARVKDLFSFRSDLSVVLSDFFRHCWYFDTSRALRVQSIAISCQVSISTVYRRIEIHKEEKKLGSKKGRIVDELPMSELERIWTADPFAPDGELIDFWLEIELLRHNYKVSNARNAEDKSMVVRLPCGTILGQWVLYVIWWH